MRRGLIEQAWIGRAECRSCGIRDLVLFADLQESDFQLIHLPINEMQIEPGGTLYTAGEEGGAAFTIRSGVVKLVQYLPDGTQRIVRLLRPGAVAGLEVLIGQPYEHTAIALQPTLVCRLPREVLDRLNQETPRLHRQLMTRWHDALKQADGWLTELNTGSSRQRVARLFLHLLDAASAPPCMLSEGPGAGEAAVSVRMLVREDVGAILSVTTETASRVVAEFKRTGLVSEVGPNAFTCDRRALEAVADEG